jgi:hypothetical protein
VFILISIFVTTATTGLFFVFTTYDQTFAYGLTVKEALGQTFDKENDETGGETGFTMEDLNPKEDLVKDLANNKNLTDEGVKRLVKSMVEQSPEFKAKQALTIKYNELQEKYYLACTVNKESGEFKDTMDCMKWSQDSAQNQLGITK